MGYAHGSGFALKLWAKGRTMGPAQNPGGSLRRGIASPHIGRRSRSGWSQVQHQLLILRRYGTSHQGGEAEVDRIKFSIGS